MSALYQLALDHSLVNCGMSYVLHLDDGRFFLIDGGYFTPGEDDRLFQFLKERSTGKPHIAGWYFSHAHQDHIGAFINFIGKYKDEVIIDEMLYYFQPFDFSGLAEETDWRSSDPATFREFYRVVENYCKGIPQHILKSGEQFYIGEMALYVVYTWEDLESPSQRFNDYSTVIRITVKGQRILFLGDVHILACEAMMKNPEALSCDIVQVSHHGYKGATEEVYRAAGAKIALWPTPKEDFIRVTQRKVSSVNEYLVNHAGIVKHIVSGNGTMMLGLPYAVS